MSKCSKTVYEGGEQTISVSPAPHTSKKFSRTRNQDFQGALYIRTLQHSKGLPAPSLVMTYPTPRSHAQPTPKMAHEPRTFWVCTTAWIIQLRRHASSPAWYTSNHPWKANCEKRVGIPWSKRLVSWSLDEPLLMSPRLCHQGKRRTRLRLCWVFPA